MFDNYFNYCIGVLICRNIGENNGTDPMSDKKKLLIPIFGVIVLVTAFVLYSPSNLLPRTMKTAEVTSIGLHLADGSNTMLLIGISMENPSSAPVTITDVDITLLVNGTDYNSMVLSGGSITVEPGQTQSIVSMVQLTGSPIGYQPDGSKVHYMLDISAEITGSARSLGLEASRTVTVQREMSWYYDKLS